jgi:hypothetical protein
MRFIAVSYDNQVLSVRNDVPHDPYFAGCAEITEDELADYKRVVAEFEAWQDKIRERLIG